jgi:hypothetical protein
MNTSAVDSGTATIVSLIRVEVIRVADVQQCLRRGMAGVETVSVHPSSVRFWGWIVSPRASMATNWAMRRVRVSARLALLTR